MLLARSQLNLLLAALLLALFPVLAAGAAQADESAAAPLHRAGLVVQHGDGKMSYAVVAFAEDSISGIDLLDRSGIAYLSVPFGGLGEGVCQIEREGCDVVECRRTVCQATRSSPFWQYLDQEADGSWHAAGLGASGSRVSDGQVFAWAWAAELPALPTLDIDTVAADAGVDPVALADLGRSGQPVAALRSGIASTNDRFAAGQLLAGGGAVLAVLVAGAWVLSQRRRRTIST